MKTVNEIMEVASLFGACSKSSDVSDWKSLVWLFFTPQGREFCEENNFPSLEMFRGMSSEVKKYGVHVDAGSISVCNDERVGIIGDTEAEMVFTDNTKVHIVILMHGAKARITVSNYAVVLLVNIENCEVEINKDKTAIIL
ncbi:hypothetical protein [Bacteroides nordii]|uniref:hypothetical protein n=1 Tax=Bacteroides nordii TaxID=291645 RepID=UPI0018AA5FA7|nr:hypothetical protein [Bacteroides nordii]